MNASYFILGDVPTTTHQHQAIRVATSRTGKHYPQIYDTTAIKIERNRLLFFLARGKPKQPLQGPVRLYVEYRFRTPKSRKGGEWKDTRPDTDNLIKLLKDCITDAGWWKDDAQVVWEECLKYYTDSDPGIYIYAEELPKKKEAGWYITPSDRKQVENG